MFGMGFGELLVVLAIALIFLGPEKIPSTARTLGRWFHEIKSSLDEVKQSFERDLQENTPSPRKPTEEKKQEASSRHLPS
jgi:Tat protein translocase TatB subunit